MQEVSGLPKSIPLGPTEYDVEALELVANPDTFALFNNEDQTIQVRSDLPYYEKLASFWHEVAHLHLDRSGLDEIFGDQHTEAVCEVIGHMMASMLMTNVVAWGKGVIIHSDKETPHVKTKT